MTPKVIPAKAGIEAFFVHGGEPKDHAVFAQDDSNFHFYGLAGPWMGTFYKSLDPAGASDDNADDPGIANKPFSVEWLCLEVARAIPAGRKAAAMILPRRRPPYAYRPVAPLPTATKLFALNTVRRKLNQQPIGLLSPPQSVLTSPGLTIPGGVAFGVFGGACCWWGGGYSTSIALYALPGGQNLQITVPTVAGTSYLVDMATCTGTWNYSVGDQAGNTSLSGSLQDQQGHLLIAFVASVSMTIISVQPVYAGGLITSVELTTGS